MAPKAWKKMKARGGKSADLWQRFGYFSAEQEQRLHDFRASGEVWWIHAVSVGESGIAMKLIRELRKRRPDLGFFVTTTTPTGLRQFEDFAVKCDGRVIPMYSALDGWFTVRRFLNLVQPAQLVLVEAEVWPNLVLACHVRGIPVSLVNARLSPRSERRFRKMRFMVETIYELLDHVGVQEAEDPQRFASALGIRPECIVHTGSIKFDTAGEKEPVEQVAAFRALLSGMGIVAERPILLAASTHPGEELALAKMYQRLRKEVPGVYYVVVPRHAERGGEITKELEGVGLQARLRSTLGGDATVSSGGGDLLVVDSTGELRAWQYLASVVVIGKSFLGIGGQNPAEAIVAAKPVVFGPHMENFSALKDLLLQHQGALEVADIDASESVIRSLLKSPAKGQQLAQAGRKALLPHAGATERTASLLLGEK
ncbi:3-deoxy-D-manno-octulosonic-acid transferase [Roseimicrobium gellanilyticum]|uniref:3-deoxy-D-manno-octulosonic acid transferase n=2 Tax=Roseimicrobium gellanilyticum TaxID=748857 RepID=A0A366HS58_9BACT|nr:3-deoxy-D-manno-octulosonic-acid transferase [Roseimicrobium gellanilyticum]